ncbi:MULTISPECIES: MFS transporter [Brevibacterium]|uniref:Major Facilitator Superfamily protein n=2 Tax=Brevibacterium antiquum TaxID=234835 RepID=A0A2H1IGL9_9MICO|nr:MULTISPECIES: MFS transporter [Brevibacterium]SMX74291.1 Major Facilitator Superfamily protein [Brevibacterium antiquum CNRZ 918]SMX86943.1 Major Facilitator Superfamily protein [Brevibacterium antiquum]
MTSEPATETADHQIATTISHSATTVPQRRAWLRVVPAMFLLAWGGNHFTPLVHMYEEDGGYAVWQANLLLGMYVGGLIPGLLVASALSDRRGRKPILVAGMIAAIVGSVLLGLGFDLFWLLCVGRVLAGIGVGVAMSVGTSWIKELSSPPFDHKAGITAGARRPALTLTVGFAIGAAVTGCLAQWGPMPETIPYAVHGLLSVVALFIVFTAPETLTKERRSAQHWWRGLRIPLVGHRTFIRLIIPAAPWVFAAAGVAYAVMPALVQEELGEWTTLFATVLTVVTLGAGALVQNLVPRINRWTGGRALVVGLTLMTLGMGLAVVAALAADPIMAFVVAIVLGIAYGICVVAGLVIVQAIAEPKDLAGITGVYYSLAYSGFLLPTVLAALLPVMPYSISLGAVAVICLLSLSVVSLASRARA